jgi:hypothetical protein
MIKSLNLLMFSFAILLTNVAFAACSSPTGSEGDVIYSAAAKQLQFCNGTTWVNTGATVQAVGGGGGATFAGATTSEYKGGGNAGYSGLYGMNQLCSADYSGSRMMRYSDAQHLTAELNGQSESGWIYCDSAACGTNSSQIGLIANCFDATGNGSSSYYDASTNRLNGAGTCALSKKIFCVYD